MMEFATTPKVRAMLFVHNDQIEDRVASLIIGADAELDSVPHQPVKLEDYSFSVKSQVLQN